MEKWNERQQPKESTERRSLGMRFSLDRRRWSTSFIFHLIIEWSSLLYCPSSASRFQREIIPRVLVFVDVFRLLRRSGENWYLYLKKFVECEEFRGWDERIPEKDCLATLASVWSNRTTCLFHHISLSLSLSSPASLFVSRPLQWMFMSFDNKEDQARDPRWWVLLSCVWLV